MSKTLVIHLKDSSTKMLKIVYESIDCDVISDGTISREKLREEIKNHDRIIMLGHGTPRGLLNPHNYGYIIDDSYADLLREKDTYSIWCYSYDYFKRNNIPGFHTGMIISETGEEQWVLGRVVLDTEEIYKNMVWFSEICRDSINMPPKEAQRYVLDNYVADDAVTQFNRGNILVVE